MEVSSQEVSMARMTAFCLLPLAFSVLDWVMGIL